MCFSLIASVAAGTALSATGVVTIKMTRRKAELPLAMIPLLFGIQQLTEGVVWYSLLNNITTLNTVSTFIYSLFSHVLWPVFIPFAVLLIETVPWRKKVLTMFQGIGLVVGLYLLYFMVTSPITSEVSGNRVVYNSPHLYVFPIMAFYLLATTISAFFSSHKFIRLFGGLAFALAVLTYWLYAVAFISVWCFFAAILSFIILLHFYNRKKYGSWNQVNG